MQRRTLIRSAALAAVSSSLGAPALAQQSDVVRLIVPYAPGGGSDRAARLVGDKLGAQLGQTVLVENKPGAGGRLAAQQLRGASADTQSLLLANPAIMVVAPLVFKNSGYDPMRDFQPVSSASSYEFVVAVGAAVPVKALSHLLAWLKANPASANFGVPATGSLPHFFGLMVGEKADVKAQVVGYRGSGPLMTDLIGGQVPVAFDTMDAVLPHAEGGRVRILASSGAKRSIFSPQIPTFREAGLDLVASGWNCFFAPAAMPAATVTRLSGAIEKVMRDADTQRRFVDAKLTPVASNAAQTAAMIKAFRAQWAPVVQRSGYQP
ncbi:tripartite tricarboxylate transporter substrate-binding protein [Ottowia sp.]|uniref:tripartite tricarboxylate transporter substrate-binding protein n=1 Tax=Ottowia sp. TaxID=1898956 RepID=UPI003A83C25B